MGDSVLVEEFVDRYYDLTEHDDALTRSQFEARMAQQAQPNDLLTRLSENGETVHLNQIDTYTDSHNPQCSQVARRKLFFGVDEALAFIMASMEAILMVFFWAALAAMLECATQEFMFRHGNGGWVLGGDDGCHTRKKFLTDLSWTFLFMGLARFGKANAGRVLRFLGLPIVDVDAALGTATDTAPARQPPITVGRPMAPVSSGGSVGSEPIVPGGSGLPDVNVPSGATEALVPMIPVSIPKKNPVTCNMFWCRRRALKEIVTKYLNLDSTPTNGPSDAAMSHWTKLVKKF